jgi:hypothetical protein
MGDSRISTSGASRLSLGAEIVWTALRVRRLVRRNDLPAAVASCRGDERQAVSELSHGEVVRVGRAVRQVVGMLPGDSSPLVSSLVVIAMLARRGIDTSLVIGVREDTSLPPQAWVELGEARTATVRPKFAQLVAL